MQMIYFSYTFCYCYHCCYCLLSHLIAVSSKLFLSQPMRVLGREAVRGFSESAELENTIPKPK